MKGKNTFLFLGMAIAIVLLSFLSLWQRSQMTRVGYGIQTLQKQKVQLLKLHKHLLIEVESISALDKIEEVATLQLSMIPASPTTRIYLKAR
jgi:cell division protein FtsL